MSGSEECLRRATSFSSTAKKLVGEFFQLKQGLSGSNFYTPSFHGLPYPADEYNTNSCREDHMNSSHLLKENGEKETWE